jgi:hypothetical protein
MMVTVKLESSFAQGVDVCPSSSVLCCPVQVQVLWWTDYQSVKSE